MNGRTWQWQVRRKRTEFAGLTAADVPALLLAAVSAVTVTVGARLLRGQNSVLMLVLGIGVAGATFVLDKLLIDRLNSIRPKQSLPALLACWMPLFLFATFLATIATFSWIVPEVATQDLRDSRRTHWTREVEKVNAYLVLVRAELRKYLDTAQLELDTQRRRAEAARRNGEPYDGDIIRRLQRRMTEARNLERRIPAIEPLPLEAPEADSGTDRMAMAFRALGDVHATALLVLPTAPELPIYEPLTPPASDVQSVLAEETKKRSWRALTAWGSALWVEVLPLLALWRGGRRIPLATRVLNWRCRIRDTLDACRGRRAPSALAIVIEPLHVRGVIRMAASDDYTLTDCTPLLEQAVGSLRDIAGSYELARVSTTQGESVDDALPLLPQLRGQPLVLSVVETQS
jgi:hypothetical protein